MRILRILYAGCVRTEVQLAVEWFSAIHNDVKTEHSTAPSVTCVRRILGGEPCDLFISADDSIIESMLMPKYANGYRIFAGNSIVVSASKPGRSITSENWIDTLLDPDITFGSFNPIADPGGYRSVMVCNLADSVKPGLSEKLLGHPGRRIYMSTSDEKADYGIGYESNAVKSGAPFARLPDSINLSNPAMNDIYATASFDLGEGYTVKGKAINHALTVLKSAGDSALAKEFAELFMQIDFTARGFLPRSGIVGDWERSEV